MHVALVCSAHGLGHVTRELVLARALIDRGTRVTVFSAAPPALVARRAPRARLHAWRADVGIQQPDSLREDVPGTLVALDQVCSDHAIDQLAQQLIRFDRVVVDTAPPALEAARRAGVPALAVGNFDWAWIYEQYAPLRPWSTRFARWQRHHPAVALWPGPGMAGFAHTTQLGLLAAPARPLPLPPNTVLVAFGGFGVRGVAQLLPQINGVRWAFAGVPPAPRGDFVPLPDAPFPELVAGAAAVFTKPGYGIFAETHLSGTPVMWVSRGRFPEARWLEDAMRARGDRQVDACPSDPSLFRAAVARTLPGILGRDRSTPPARLATERLCDLVLGPPYARATASA